MVQTELAPDDQTVVVPEGFGTESSRTRWPWTAVAHDVCCAFTRTPDPTRFAARSAPGRSSPTPTTVEMPSRSPKCDRPSSSCASRLRPLHPHVPARRRGRPFASMSTTRPEGLRRVATSPTCCGPRPRDSHNHTSTVPPKCELSRRRVASEFEENRVRDTMSKLSPRERGNLTKREFDRIQRKAKSILKKKS